jgi:hypothetical protein
MASLQELKVLVDRLGATSEPGRPFMVVLEKFL